MHSIDTRNSDHKDTPAHLTLKDFSFEVPENLIAQQPLASRDQSRMLVWRDSACHHDFVTGLPGLVPRGTLFIVNVSKVIASRIRFLLPTGGQSELLLLEPTTDQPFDDTFSTWKALGRPMRRFKLGQLYNLGNALEAKILELPPGSESGASPMTISLSLGGTALLNWLEAYGEMPLPPYIERGRGEVSDQQKNNALDRERYQTVYAEPSGSVAAPTAGLHFSDDLIKRLEAHNCQIEPVTLHVGAGTFLPVKTLNLDQHVMHSERFMVPSTTLAAIRKAQESSRPVVVVGTTALRALEGLDHRAKELETSREALGDSWHRTQIFIKQKTRSDIFTPWACDGLMTNFHQPESTLFMLISALVGFDPAKSIYASASAEGYRFFSYGDSSLLWLPGKNPV